MNCSADHLSHPTEPFFARLLYTSVQLLGSAHTEEPLLPVVKWCYRTQQCESLKYPVLGAAKPFLTARLLILELPLPAAVAHTAKPDRG